MEKIRRMMIPFILSLLLACNLVTGHVQAEASSNLFSRNAEQLLQELTLEENSRGIHTGIAVYNLTKNEYIYQHNIEKAYVPASNLKLFTTVAALETLGPDYQYVTDIYLDGKLAPGGILNGNLLVKGYGDPSFSLEDLQNVAEQLKEKGIKRINGDLLVDESFFDTQRLGPEWMWDDEVYAYSAQVSALAIQKNSLSVEIKPGAKVGDAPKLETTPLTSYVHFLNETKTVPGTESDIQFARARGTNVVTVTGTIGTESESVKEDLAVDDPALYVGDVWKQQLEAAGIGWNPTTQVRKAQLKKGVPFVTHTSKPLSEIIHELNKESDNFYAEMLTKTLGATRKGEGSFSAGSAVIAEVLKQAGIEHDYRLVDGSGLSRLDFITPAQMIKLLSYVQVKEYHSVFEESLPIAGVDGTLESRLKGTAAENNLHAKTGSMGGVNSLSGYVTAQNGEKLAFCILINGIYKSRYATALQDKLAVLLAGYPDLTEPVGTEQHEKRYELSQLLDPLLEKESLKGITTGISIRSLDREEPGKLLYERNSDKLLTPSSGLLAVTGAAAIQLLGNEYRFKTEVYTSVPVPANGVVQGDLIVKGYGDPSLYTEDEITSEKGRSLEEIERGLQEKGIRKINGNLVVDDSYFDNMRLGLGWPWDQESNPQFAQISALAVNHGTVKVKVQPAVKAGEHASVFILPKTDSLQVINQAITVAATEPTSVTVTRFRGKNILLISGKIPAGKEENRIITVEEPGLFTGAVLQEKLKQAGIKLAANSKTIAGIVPQGSVKLVEVTSEPLQDMVTHMVKEADSFYGEMLVKALGAEEGLPGTTEQGVTRIQTWLKALGANPAFDMIDGSGLTRYNLISANQLVSVLELMAKQDEDHFRHYLGTFPVAGVDRMLSERLKGTAAANNVRAISGNVTGVSSLTGYVTTKEGERLAFSILMNGYAADTSELLRVQDQVMLALADYKQ